MTLDSLDALEAKVQEAADRIAALAERNAELEQSVAELEAGRERGTGSADERGAAAWQAEKSELKRRVDLLVARLEELLGES